MGFTRKLAGSFLLAAVVASAGGLILVLRASIPEERTPSGGFDAVTNPVASGSDANVLEPAPVVKPAGELGATQADDRALPDGIWIRGRVILPAGTPADERIEIAARVLSFDDAPGYVAAVGADGSFLAMFPKDADSGWLELRARYLVLDPNFEVDLEVEEPLQEVVLEPTLGGCVRGRIVVPERFASERGSLTGTCVKLSAESDPALPAFHYRRTCVESDLRFEFTGVPPGSGFTLSGTTMRFLPFERPIDVLPGSTVEVDVALHPGVRVSGRVVDPDGKPVAGARAWSVQNNPLEPSMPDRRVREPLQLNPNVSAPDLVSAQDGTFAIVAIPPGKVTIEFQGAQYLRQTLDLGKLEDGDARENLEVRLLHGLISGQVRWPDGRPVDDCAVRLRSDSPADGATQVREWEARSMQVSGDGRFAFAVSHDGPYSLSVRSPAYADAAKNTDSGSLDCGVVHVEGLHPGPTAVLVTLEPAHAVRGKVVDELGQPVERFLVGASRNSSGLHDGLLDTVSGFFHETSGTFTLTGLAPGTWRFAASFQERKGAWSEPVDFPGSVPPLVLLLPRGGTVSGVVLDPTGSPGRFAQVHVGSSDRRTDAGKDGRFEIRDLPARGSPVLIWATSEEWASSEPVWLRLEPGRSASVQLVLRRGGRLVGTALDAENRPDVGRVVAVQCDLGGGIRRITADQEGAFQFDDLPPGRCLLWRIPQKDEVESGTGATSETARRFAAARTKVWAEVESDGETRVLIGGPKGEPIRVRGRVLDGGAPVVDQLLQASESWGDAATKHEWTTGAEGRFEMVLDEPGDIRIRLDLEMDDTTLRTSRRIPEAASRTLDLFLPRGSISGIVVLPEGRPLGGSKIHLNSGVNPDRADSWSVSADTTSGPDGKFTFHHVPEGNLELSMLSDWTIVEAEVVMEEGGTLTGVELRLP